MKKRLILAILLAFALSCKLSRAQDGIDMFTPQKQTPDAVFFDTISMPEVFENTNNLTRRAGSFYTAVGEPLIITGRITDAFEVPISGAVIKIWQTNASGKYQALMDSDDDYYDEHFLGSGTAISDNAGRYLFFTIFPGFYESRTPHINIVITHEKFGQIRTEMYFADHPRNKNDMYYMSYPNDERLMVTAPVEYVEPKRTELGKIARFNITMDGVHLYKRY